MRRTRGRSALSRKPKQLTSAPTVFEATDGGGGGIVLVPTAGRSAHNHRARGGGTTTLTDEPADVVALDDHLAQIDPAVRAAAREIAAGLWIRRSARASRFGAAPAYFAACHTATASTTSTSIARSR